MLASAQAERRQARVLASARAERRQARVLASARAERKRAVASPYTPEVPRWLAVGLGCVTALGLQALFSALLAQTPLGAAWIVGYVTLFLALALAGYVTGHLVGRWQVLYAALTAVLYILITATFQATREALVAREVGLAALAPIDFVQLTLTDVLAMTAASCGGWVAERFQLTTGAS